MRSPLSPERWSEVENLFVAAAEMPPEPRQRFVQSQCGGDTELSEEVFSLLRYDTGGLEIQQTIEQGALSILAGEPLEGTMLGPWLVARELGRGGMSVVYLATRADGRFAKRVAIKVIKRGMDTAAVVERFYRERRILAALDHPFIARLLDAGATPDGLPYIVMDYVEGLPIDRWCEDWNPTVQQRCELIGKVCDAVAYAHRKLVIHRDLKPGNILVDGGGDPKLLDFGIAKLLGDGVEPTGETETRAPMRPLTPEYASPEQLSDGSVGTATDVYSLAVVLFELLVGRRPRKVPGRSDAEKASEASLELRPCQPEKDGRWARSLSGDLDNILQMALRDDPERRYLTVEQFRSDLRRYLAGLPVAARPETWHYRLGKFLRRHPFGAAASVAALAGIVLFVFVERDAQLQRAKSEQRLGELVALANTTLFDLHGAIEYLPGATQARLEIARKTTGYLDKLNRESGNDPRVLSALASAYTRVARVQGNPGAANLGDNQGAEQNYSKAERILAALLASGKNTPALLLQDAGIRREYGEVLAYKGRSDQALSEYQAALDQAGKVLAQDPRSVEARRMNTTTRLDMANVTRIKDPAGTRRALLDLLPACESLTREYPGNTDLLHDLTTLWEIVGQTHSWEGNMSGAADSFRKSAALRERLYALQPEDVQVQRDLMMAYGHLGDIVGGPAVINMGDYGQAVVWFGKAAAIAERMMAADPSNALARRDAGTAIARIGASQTAAGEYRAALENFRRAEPLLRAVLAASPESVIVGQTLAFMYNSQGQAFHAVGDENASIDALRRSIDLCRRGLKKDPAGVSWNHVLWGAEIFTADALAAKGETDAALTGVKVLLDEVRREPVPHDPSGHAYLARAMSANGAVHSILARKSSGENRAAEWRTARDFFGDSLKEWQLEPNRAKEPLLRQMRIAEAGLAQSRRELQRVGPEPANGLRDNLP